MVVSQERRLKVGPCMVVSQERRLKVGPDMVVSQERRSLWKETSGRECCHLLTGICREHNVITGHVTDIS